MEKDVGCQEQVLSLSLACEESPPKLSDQQLFVQAHSRLLCCFAQYRRKVRFSRVALPPWEAQLAWVAILWANYSLKKQELVEVSGAGLGRCRLKGFQLLQYAVEVSVDTRKFYAGINPQDDSNAAE